MIIEFLISEAIENEGGLIVRGVCNKGDIRVGAVFSSLRNSDGLERELHFRVGKIIAYRREIDLLPMGMSGEIYLNGDNFSDIVHGDMLSG